MKKSVVALFILVAGSLAQAAATEGIDWFSGDVDAAFAEAKKDDKPVFLYWGAAWCPPCNQVKATIFNRQDFIARSRFFVPVHIDGDSPGAQKLGERFKVRGYPTTILFRPDGTEITRLPGEVDGARYLRVLALGMNATHPVRTTLANALGDKPTLDANGWRLLSFYAWDTDEQQLVQHTQRVKTLQRLAKAAPPGEAATRLQLLALVAAANERPEDRPGADNARANATLMQVFARQDQARSNADVLTNFSAKLVAANSAPASPARRQLLRAGDAALARLARDRNLSTTDQLMARDAQLQLAALPGASVKPAAALVHAAQAQVAAADRATTDVYERQSVISAAADVLTDAGLLDESDRLLNAELSRSHSPYYFMLGLAANAKKRGDNPTALKWYQQAWEQATGPATRLQWGTTYLTNLIELSPADEGRIEKTARSVFDELAQTPDAFYERSRIRLEGLGHKLTDWKAARHEAAFARVAAQLNGICGKLPAADAQRATCLGILAPA
jgi:thioredoxin-related protein